MSNGNSPTGLSDAHVQQVLNNPDFINMARKKSSLSRLFTIITILMYFIYMVTLGINPELFATPVSAGSTTTWGIYLGLGVILVSILLTGIYVHKANGEFDVLTQKVVQDIQHS